MAKKKHRLINGDCLSVLEHFKTEIHCIFADPPDGIDLKYNSYNDRMPADEYRWLAERWVDTFVAKSPIVWLSFNARWTVMFGAILDKLPSDYEVKPCVQVFTFGQHRDSDLGNNHRPLWRIRRKDAPIYPDQIRVPSWRQRNGDKRASAKGRVPGDVFDMQYPYGPLSVRASEGAITYTCPLETARGVLTTTNEPIAVDVQPGDVFDFPRVTGNSKQRCDWHPTQLHEELVERCIKLSTLEGQHVVDPFGGTGTTLRVCKSINRLCTLIELDSHYCDKIAEQHPGLARRAA